MAAIQAPPASAPLSSLESFTQGFSGEDSFFGEVLQPILIMLCVFAGFATWNVLMRVFEEKVVDAKGCKIPSGMQPTGKVLDFEGSCSAALEVESEESEDEEEEECSSPKVAPAAQTKLQLLEQIKMKHQASEMKTSETQPCSEIRIESEQQHPVESRAAGLRLLEHYGVFGATHGAWSGGEEADPFLGCCCRKHPSMYTPRQGDAPQPKPQ